MAKRPIAEATKADNQAAQDARLWKKELQLADKREKEWRDEAEKIVKRYRGEERKKNRFNILWSNTEILRPAVYNSTPNPDVRRRFRDADPVGKAVSEVIERCLYVFCDGYDTDCAIKNDVLDALLVGRGVSRNKYEPQISQVPRPKSEKAEGEGKDDEDETDEVDEELEYERTQIDHVDWRDYREGYGRVWEEVPWVAFRHKLTRKDAADLLGKEALKGIEFARPTTDDSRRDGEQVNETQKVADFWEIWDKTGKRVFFVQDSAQVLLFPKDNPTGEPPIDYAGFFPCPEPLAMFENTGSRIPVPIFNLYKEQADELDKLSGRIDKIVNTLRLRGVYDGKLTELADLLDSTDNELTPVQNAQAWLQSGLEKAIAWMPTDPAVAVLKALYEARASQKAIIDELTGISDIVRGNTDPDETYGAQQLKSNYASVRLRRMQKEVQRYSRDLLRLAGDVIASKFSQQTLAQMTDLKFPTAEQKAQLQQQIMLAQQQAQQTGQPPQGPDPSLLKVPSWDEIMQLMHSPALRQQRIDVETDSTIAGSLDSDMKGLAEVMTAISTTLTGVTPLVQAQALPVDAAKELVLTVIRRARMGMAVEDAFDKLKAPAPPPPPPPDHSVQVAQIKAESDQKIEQMRQAGDKAKFQAEASVDVAHQQLMEQREQFSQQLKHEREQTLHANKLQAEQFDSQLQAQKEFALAQQKANDEHIESRLDAAVRIIVAQIQAKSQEAIATASAEKEVARDLQ